MYYDFSTDQFKFKTKDTFITSYVIEDNSIIISLNGNKKVIIPYTKEDIYSIIKTIRSQKDKVPKCLNKIEKRIYFWDILTFIETSAFIASFCLGAGIPLMALLFSSIFGSYYFVKKDCKKRISLQTLEMVSNHKDEFNEFISENLNNEKLFEGITDQTVEHIKNNLVDYYNLDKLNMRDLRTLLKFVNGIKEEHNNSLSSNVIYFDEIRNEPKYNLSEEQFSSSFR